MEEWDTAEIEVDQAQTWSATFNWNLGVIIWKLREGHNWNLGQPNSHLRVFQCNVVACRPNSHYKNPDNKSDDSENLTAFKQLVLAGKKFWAPHFCNPGSANPIWENPSKTQTYAYTNWTLEYLPMELVVKVDKRRVGNLKEGEVVWLVDDFFKRLECKLDWTNKV